MTAARHVLVVGAGLAGLAAAVSAREHGADVTVLERNDVPGGATADSVGWIWRYVDLATARACAPHADPAVLAAVVVRLDEDLEWLERHGVRRRSSGTGRALTDGVRVDPRQALDALTARLGEDRVEVRSSVIAARPRRGGGYELCVRRGRPGALQDSPDTWLAGDAVVFAGGGYARDLERIASESGVREETRSEWVLRAPQGGDGSSMDAAISLGALRVPATGECLARVVPHIDDGGADALDPRMLGHFGELHRTGSVLRSAAGAELVRPAHDWSGAQLVWQLARTSGAGRLELPRAELRRDLGSGTVEDVLRAAVALGAQAGRGDGGSVWLAVRAGITHTLCGLRVDADARLQQASATRGLLRRQPGVRALDGCFAAGCDAAGTGLGGTASGLAQALVLGRRAGELAATGA